MLNFKLKFLFADIPLFETVIQVPPEGLTLAFLRMPEKIRERLLALHSTAIDNHEELLAQVFVFDIERAINSQTGLRCHAEQLPPDVPRGMKVEDDELSK